MKTWAKLKGWEVAGEYVDAGYTGGDDKRPELRRLMLDARRHAFDIAAVAKIDRFMRNLRLLKNYLHELENLGVSFVAAQEGVDTSEGGTGRLLLNILASFAEFERERIGERVRDTRSKLIEAGRWPSGRTLYGYRWNKEGKRFEVVGEEAEVVRKIFDLYVNGNIGQVQVAAKLNEEGYRTRPKKGNGYEEPQPRPWWARGIWDILKDRRYTGKDDHFAYPPITSEPLFEAAQRKRKEARQVLRNPGQWLLQGMVSCGLCGHKVGSRQKRKSGVRRYVCRGTEKAAHLDGSAHCNLRSIPAEALETMVWRRFVEVASNGELLTESVKRALAELDQRRKHLDDGASVEAELLRIEEQKARAWDAHIDGHMPKDKMLIRIERLEAREQELRARLQRLDPAARLEVARLEDFIAEVRRILAVGSIAIRDDGIWACGFSEGIQDAFHLGSAEPEPLRPAVRVELKTVEAVNPPLHLRIRQTLWDGSTTVASMRRLLEKFDVQVVAFPDRIEIRGLIPTQVIECKEGQVFASATDTVSPRFQSQGFGGRRYRLAQRPAEPFSPF